MEKRRLGRSALELTPLMFGGNVFGWTADEATSFRLMDAYLDAGGDAIDTADAYSAWVPGNVGGESETIIGKWLKQRGRRDDVIVATKVAKWGKRPGLSAANIEAAAEDSLRRLQTDYIDLYQSHEDDAQTPLDETLTAYDRLVKAGKVRVIGASNYDADRLVEAVALSEAEGLPRYESLQPLYSLVERKGFEIGLLPCCQAHEIGVITYYSLASGFLAGKYRSEKDAEGKARGSRVTEYLTPAGLALLDVMDGIAGAHNATPAQVAISWVANRPGVTAAIASATAVPQLQELMVGAALKLTAEQTAQLDAASSTF